MGSIHGFKNGKGILFYLLKIISWSVFSILFIIASFLIYYFVESRIYASQGKKHAPGFSLFTIISGSMEPQIKVYDVVFEQKIKDFSAVKSGDVITFYSNNQVNPGMIITHRVTEVNKAEEGYYFHTKGDNNDQEDSGKVFQDQIIGKVLMKFPQLGRVQMIVSNNLGWILFILLPALLIIGYDFIKISKTLNINKKSELIINQRKDLERKDLTALKNQLLSKRAYKCDDNEVMPKLKV